MAPKVRKVAVKRPSANIYKKPSAVIQAPPEEGTAAALSMVVSYVDNKAFKSALGKQDCPDAVREEANRILGLGFGQGKSQQMKEMVANWKVHGWEAPIFNEHIEMNRS